MKFDLREAMLREILQLRKSLSATQAELEKANRRADGFKWLVEQHKHDAEKARVDAERLSAMADEWTKAVPEGMCSSMPIWDALCDAIGNGADGNGLRAAIDKARSQTT